MSNSKIIPLKAEPEITSTQNQVDQYEDTHTLGWLASIFINNRLVSTANVIESNEQGAHLRLNSAAELISQDSLITINLQTYNINLSKTAIVKWLQQNEATMECGIEYIDHTGFDPADHHLDVNSLRIDPIQALRLPANIAKRQKALPFIELNGKVNVACCDVQNTTLMTLLERLFKKPIVLWVCDEAPLLETLNRVYGENMGQIHLANRSQNEESTTEAVNQSEALLYAAYMQQASDIHIDPGYDGARIRFRVDGQLDVYKKINSNIYVELISRLKVMASLDIAEKRSPQDGRFSHQFVAGGRRIDVRVATLPTKYGERMTMRLLALQTETLTLDNLGFERYQQQTIETFLRRIQGMMIMTGPTGSGKTTTLYAAIRLLLEGRNVNIITIEDPIEYEIEGVAQSEVDNADKVSFAKALRSILRHDPDVVMIGEIRDKETADIAIKAALTGHMVLGTLHTNSAAGTVTRLVDMGVEPYLISAALRLSVAQRLLRKLCDHCKISRPLTDQEALTINKPKLAGEIIYDPSGCIYCMNKGYAGRIGLYEMLELNEQWACSIAQGAGESELVANMRKAGIASLLDDAITKLRDGKTSVPEVIQIATSW